MDTNKRTTTQLDGVAGKRVCADTAGLELVGLHRAHTRDNAQRWGTTSGKTCMQMCGGVAFTAQQHFTQTFSVCPCFGICMMCSSHTHTHTCDTSTSKPPEQQQAQQHQRLQKQQRNQRYQQTHQNHCHIELKARHIQGHNRPASELKARRTQNHQNPAYQWTATELIARRLHSHRDNSSISTISSTSSKSCNNTSTSNTIQF